MLQYSTAKFIPYTDTSTVAIPVVLLFLYTMFRYCNKKNGTYFLWLLLMCPGILGGIMKATCYVTLIAILLVDLLWSILEETSFRIRMRRIGIKAILLAAAFCMGIWCRQGMWIFVLLGIVTEAVLLLLTAIGNICNGRPTAQTSDTLCLSVVMIVIFIGTYLFVMLFEARARYLYNTVPVFSTMAMLGYGELYRKLSIFCSKKRK